MRAGAISTVACPRKNKVPVTASSPSSPRTRCEISSRPVASGTLLGPLRLVALPPAQAGVAHDLVLELQDPVDQRLRARRTPRHVHVDGEELVGARDQRIVVE